MRTWLTDSMDALEHHKKQNKTKQKKIKIERNITSLVCQ